MSPGEGDARQRASELRALFRYWDAAGEGYIGAPQLCQVIKTVQDATGEGWPAVVQERFSSMERMVLPLLSAAARELGLDLPDLAVVSGVSEDGNFLPDALDQSAFCAVLSRLTDPLDSAAFERFIKHCYTTVQFFAELTSTARCSRCIFAVFQQWDSAGRGGIELAEFERVMRSLPPEASAPVISPTGALRSDVLGPEAEATGMVRLKDFQRVVQVMGDSSEVNVVAILRTVMGLTRKTRSHHLVTKYLEEGRAAQEGRQGAAKQPTADARRPSHHLGTPECLTEERTERLRQEMRHALDALTLQHVEQHIAALDPPEYVHVVSAVMALLLDIQPAANPNTFRLEHWEGFKQRLSADFVGFLHQMSSFDPANVTQCPLHKVRRAMVHYFRPEFDPNNLLRFSWFFSALCAWCRCALQLACLAHGWTWPPPPQETATGGGSADAGASPRRQVPPPPARRAVAYRADQPPVSRTEGLPVTGSAGFLVLHHSPRKDRMLRRSGPHGVTPRRIATLAQNHSVLDAEQWLSPQRDRQMSEAVSEAPSPLVSGRKLSGQHLVHLQQIEKLNKELALGPCSWEGVV